MIRNNGFLKYYTIGQLPNFLLAFPVWTISASAIFDYARADLKLFFTLGFRAQVVKTQHTFFNARLLPFVYLSLFLLVYCSFWMHIQVIIRFFTWNPVNYWYLAYLADRKVSKLFFIYLIYSA